MGRGRGKGRRVRLSPEGRSALDSFRTFRGNIQNLQDAAFEGTLNGRAGRVDRFARSLLSNSVVDLDTSKSISRLASDLRDIPTIRDARLRQAEYAEWLERINAIRLPK